MRCKTCKLDKEPEDFRTRPAPNQHLKYKECRGCENGSNKTWREATDRDRRKVLWNYGMTPEQYDHMLEQQGGVCKICKGPPDEGRSFHVDHDHDCCPGRPTCGKCNRGLLCGRCNKGLGQFHDDPVLLVAAANYLLSAGGG